VLTLAGPDKAAARESKRIASEEAWTEANRQRSPHGTNDKMKQAAVDGARNDITDWLAIALADSPSAIPGITMKLIRSIAQNISEDVLDALRKGLEADNFNVTTKELALKHLFCTLLAAVSQEIQQINDGIDAAVEHIAASMLNYFIGQSKIELPRELVHIVAHAMATNIEKLINSLPVIQHLNNLQQAAQIMAVITCPAPEKHEAVIKYCVEPLDEPIVSNIIQQRLKIALPEWLA
jgi:flagellar biosynthesis/type III secretory pathway protein FliH